MVSFKLKLVSYFVLLTLVPLGAAYWGFESLARRSETRSADARLQAGLRSALYAYDDAVIGIGRTATRLARSQSFQQALRAHERAALARYARETKHLRIRVGGSFAAGAAPHAPAVVRTVAVVYRRHVLGQVEVWLPLDTNLMEHVARRSGLGPDDRLVVSHAGRVVLGPQDLVGRRLQLSAGSPVIGRIGDSRWRVLSAPALDEPRGYSLSVVTPQATIEAAAARSERALAIVLAALVLLTGAIAYLLGRSIVGTLARFVRAAGEITAGRLDERLPAGGRDEFGQLARAFNQMAQQLQSRLVELESERSRLGRATNRIGEALAATHDADQLLAVLVEAAVEATGAYGGTVRDARGSVRARTGDPEAGIVHLEVPLLAGRQNFGVLVLSGPAFADEAREAAVSLASQAVIALENARLHQIVERQALADGLTGLANRRAGEEALRTELQRAERFGGDLAVVIADLDGFKDVNDRHGHAAGDVVLREFAQRLRDTVREIDVAARWGGEEFCLLLPGTDAAGGARVAERARAALEGAPVEVPGGTPIHVTASFGVAAFPDYAVEEALLEAADGALYEAKGAGKNRVVTATQRVGST
jgi:diguanylate cyclase (GGDEF)-like protein